MSVSSATRIDIVRFQAGCGLALLMALFLLAALHHILAPYSSGVTDVAPVLAPPGPVHAFGSDLLGRDLFSETLHALSVTLTDASLALALVLVFGNLAGIFTAHVMRRAGILFRVGATVIASVPSVLLGVLIAALLGRENAALATGLAVAPYAFLRSYDMARASLAMPYADFARAAGVGTMALMRRDIVHGGPVATAARGLAAVTVTLSTLSFFGFGATPPQRDLGLMIASAHANMLDAWWTIAAPICALVLVVLAARLAAGLSGGERP